MVNTTHSDIFQFKKLSIKFLYAFIVSLILLCGERTGFPNTNCWEQKASFETNNSSSSQKFSSFLGTQIFISDKSVLLVDDVATLGNRIPWFRHKIMSLPSRVEMFKINCLQMPWNVGICLPIDVVSYPTERKILGYTTTKTSPSLYCSKIKKRSITWNSWIHYRKSYRNPCKGLDKSCGFHGAETPRLHDNPNEQVACIGDMSSA